MVSPAEETQALLAGDEMKSGGVLTAPWTATVRSTRDSSRRLPQAIAHRGYKASWPENSMGAFKGAVEVGAHAIETDVHLSADGVVVLSHDPSLKRCFGVDKRIADCDWEYLSTLRTLREPRQALPRLRDLLDWLAEPGLHGIWVLLDIKLDDEADALVSAIAEAVADAPAPVPWNERLLLGCWNATFIKTCRRILPDFSTALITFSLIYARHFLKVPGLGFNVNQRALVGPFGSFFLRRVHNAHRPVFVWTVNAVKNMEWCLRQNGAQRKGTLASPTSGQEAVKGDTQHPGPAAVDAAPYIHGVITDDPKLFLQVCDRWEDQLDGNTAAEPRASVPRRLRGGLSALVKYTLENMFLVALYLHRRYVLRRLDFFKDPKTLSQ